MAGPLPPEVTVTEGARGVRYRFPSRPLGSSRWIGLALLVLGLTMCVLPFGAACKVIQVLVRQLPAESAWFWLLVTILTLLPLRFAPRLATVGLFILAGHSEIELRRDTLFAPECCGPLGWTWQRSTADLRRFLVSESLGPLSGATGREVLAAALNFLLGRRGGLGVIIPQWKATVGGTSVPPLWLAPGYPRPWLLAVAEDLARRCPWSAEPATAPAAPGTAQAIVTPAPGFPITPTVPSARPVRPEPTRAPSPRRIVVVEQDAGLTQYEELDERPAGSKIAVDTSPGGLTFIVPPMGWHAHRGWVAGGMLPCLIALGLTLSVFGTICSGSADVWGVAVMLLIALPVWALGIGLLLVAYNGACRRVVLDVTCETLVVWQSGLFRARPGRWSQEQLADVFVMHQPGGEDLPDYWELQIHPQPGHGPPLRLLDHRDEAELRWLATMVRRTLRCPGTSPNSPPPGFVVQSPGLLANWHKRRSTT
jgi:hypothetical protein